MLSGIVERTVAHTRARKWGHIEGVNALDDTVKGWDFMQKMRVGELACR